MNFFKDIQQTKYLLLFIFIGLAILVLHKYLSLVTANLYLVSSFLIIFFIIGKTISHPKKSLAFLSVFFIFSLLIYYQLTKFDHTTLISLFLVVINLFLILHYNKRLDCSHIRVKAKQIIAICLVATFSFPLLCLFSYKIESKSAKIVLNQQINQIKQLLEKENNTAVQKNSQLLGSGVIADLMGKQSYGDLAAYCQNIKTANDLDYLSVVDITNKIIIDTQNKYAVGSVFPGSLPADEMSLYTKIDDQIYLLSSQSIYVDKIMTGKVISGTEINAKNINQILAKEKLSVDGLLLSQKGKLLNFSNNNQNLNYLLSSEGLSNYQTVDYKLKSFNYKGQNFLLYGGRIISLNGEDIDLFLITPNNLVHNAQKGFAIFVSIFLCAILYLEVKILQIRIKIETGLKIKKETIELNRYLKKHIKNKISIAKLKHLTSLYRNYWHLIGDTSIILIASFVVVNVAIIQNLSFIYTKADINISPAVSSTQTTIPSAISVDVVPTDPYLVKNIITDVVIKANPLTFEEISVDISYDPESFELADHFDKNYTCKTNISSININIDCIKNVSPLNLQTQEVTYLKFKPLKTGFTSLTINNLNIYDASGTVINLPNTTLRSFGFWVGH